MGLSIAALPVIMPVVFVVDEADRISFRPPTATKTIDALADAVVCFEVDRFDDRGTGWTVAVTGVASVDRAGDGAPIVSIPTELISGYATRDAVLLLPSEADHHDRHSNVRR